MLKAISIKVSDKIGFLCSKTILFNLIVSAIISGGGAFAKLNDDYHIFFFIFFPAQS